MFFAKLSQTQDPAGLGSFFLLSDQYHSEKYIANILLA